jgi:hypothetical protein
VAQGVISSLKKYQWNNGTPLMVPIEYCLPPTESWKCRDRDNSFVKKLVESLRRTPDAIPYMEPAATVIFDEELSKDVQTMTDEEVLALIKKKGGFVYHGDHRRQAINNLHELYGGNPYFSNLRTMITILPNEEEFKRQLYAVGLAVNLLGELKNPVSWAERLRAMHTHWVRDVSITTQFFFILFKKIFFIIIIIKKIFFIIIIIKKIFFNKNSYSLDPIKRAYC